MKCFYHSADLDGHCSGAIVKKFFPTVELIGYNYGQPFPMDEISGGDTVVMVDVSLPMEQMFELNERCGRLNWIDHHISAIKEHDAMCGDKPIPGLRRTDRAACELIWEFYSSHPVPEVVQYLGIYDSWRFAKHEEQFIKQFQCGMRTIHETRPEYAMPDWEALFAGGSALEKIGDRGQVIWKYQLSQNEKTCGACAFETVLNPPRPAGTPPVEGNGLRCVAVNSNLMNSDVFRSVWDPAKYDAMLCFYRSNKGFWRVSIYSDRPDVDCSVWVKSYGGGGHKGAAGFRCEELPFALNVQAGCLRYRGRS
jgi:uncharacterized protein